MLTRIKKSKVATLIDYLEAAKFIKRSGSGRAIPFFIITKFNKKVDFKFGRNNIEPVIKKNIDLLSEIYDKETINDLKSLREENLSKFLNQMNLLVKKEWKDDNKVLVYIEIGTKAIRYYIPGGKRT